MSFARVAAVGLVLGSLVAAPAAQAQKDKDKAEGLLLGAWVGVNFATFGGASATNVTTRTGVAFGGQAQFPLVQSVFLRLGLIYSMRGAGSNGTPGGTTALNYLEIPAEVGYQFPLKGSSIQPYVMVGAQLGIKSSCNITTGGTTTECNSYLGYSVAGGDIGARFGGGAAFPVGRAHLMVDLLYYAGFTNLIANAGAGAVLKNQGFTIGVGYMAPLGRH